MDRKDTQNLIAFLKRTYRYLSLSTNESVHDVIHLSVNLAVVPIRLKRISACVKARDRLEDLT